MTVAGPLRVAVVGSGPAGLYMTDALTSDSVDGIEVDVIERLPAPYGLLRYGVAPDHVKIKAAMSVLAKVLARPQVRLIANVDVGADISVDELRACYDAVFYAFGASADRALGIPGEHLPGSQSATSFVSWYNGHPDRNVHALDRTGSVAVIGNGNVALDVARLLLARPDDLEHTDIPPDVLAELRRSTVTDVHLFGRRAARHAKFTSKELREIGELPEVDVIVDAPSLDAGGEETTPNAKRNLALLEEWAGQVPQERPRRLHLHFQYAPREIVGVDHVRLLRLDRTDAEGRPVGETVDLDTDLVLRSIGYSATPMAGLSFDLATNTVPTIDHRVVRDGATSTGEYAVGWIKRGPTGILGTNKKDASETIAAFRADADLLRSRRVKTAPSLDALLDTHGLHPIDLDGWNLIVAAEVEAGARHNRGQIKLTDRQVMLAAAGIRIVPFAPNVALEET